MNKLKETLFYLFFGAEVLIFIYLFIFGTYGLCDVWRMDSESSFLQEQIVALAAEIKTLEYEKICWVQNTFYRERSAREQLHMARADEEIYYLADVNSAD